MTVNKWSEANALDYTTEDDLPGKLLH
jgi:hypothetical protein